MRVRRTLVAAVVLLAAAGCSGGGSSTAGPTKADPKLCPVKALEGATGPVEIAMWHVMNAANEATLNKLTDTYNSSQSKVKVTLVNQVSYEENFQKYLGAVRTGSELPQIVQLAETTLQAMIDSQTIVPIGSCVAADGYDLSDFTPLVVGQYSVNGALQAMPFQLSTPVLYYNKKAFAAAGLDPERPPATLDEVLEYSRKIVAVGKAGGATSKGFALEAQGWYTEQLMSKAGEAIVNNDNGRARRATEARLDSKTFTDALDFIAALQKEGLLFNTGKNPSGRDHLLAVAQRDAAMTIGTSAALGTVYQLLPAFPGVALGVGPLPGPAGGGVTAGGGSLYLVAKSSTDEERAAVWDYLKFLNTVDSQVVWHIGTGYVPTRLSAATDAAVVENWTDRPGFKVAFDQLASATVPVGGGGPLVGDYQGLRDAEETAIETVASGGDVAAAQAKAQADATAAITEYNRRVGG